MCGSSAEKSYGRGGSSNAMVTSLTPTVTPTWATGPAGAGGRAGRRRAAPSTGGRLLGGGAAVDLRDHLDHPRELVCLEARAADQAAVAERQLDVGADVPGVRASSVEDPHAGRCLVTEGLVQNPADNPHRPVSVLGIGVLAGSDGPDRLGRGHPPGRIPRRHGIQGCPPPPPGPPLPPPRPQPGLPPA